MDPSPRQPHLPVVGLAIVSEKAEVPIRRALQAMGGHEIRTLLDGDWIGALVARDELRALVVKRPFPGLDDAGLRALVERDIAVVGLGREPWPDGVVAVAGDARPRDVAAALATALQSPHSLRERRHSAPDEAPRSSAVPPEREVGERRDAGGPFAGLPAAGRGLVVGLAAPQGGLGVTTAAIALAAVCGQRRAAVLIDAHPRLPGVGTLLDLDPRLTSTALQHLRPDGEDAWLLAAAAHLQPIRPTDEGFAPGAAPGCWALPLSPHADQRARLDPAFLLQFVALLRRLDCVVVLDLGQELALDGPLGRALARATDLLLLVTEASVVGQERALALRATLARDGLADDRLRLLVGRHDPATQYPLREVAECQGCDVLLALPHDPANARLAERRAAPLGGLRPRRWLAGGGRTPLAAAVRDLGQALLGGRLPAFPAAADRDAPPLPLQRRVRRVPRPLEDRAS